jgi:hypothetical protein
VQLKVLWVFNVQQTNWEKQLPEDTLAMLDRSRSKRGGLYAKEGATEAESDGELIVITESCTACRTIRPMGAYSAHVHLHTASMPMAAAENVAE